MTEEIFFEHGNVKVTNARFVVGNQTYAMNGVTSVKNTIIPAKRTLGIVLAVVGVLMLLGSSESGIKVFGFLLAVAGGVLAYVAKATHVVVLHSSSGETQALTGTDRTYIGSVIEALNQSLIHRG
jgi:hypothetical protein